MKRLNCGLLDFLEPGGAGRSRTNSSTIEGAIKLNIFYRNDSLTIMVIHVKSLASLMVD